MRNSAMFSLKSLCVLSIALAGIVVPMEASIITVPTGLAPGSQYRLVFVTNSAYQLQSTSISTYNNDVATEAATITQLAALGDRKSTRLNSSHLAISYAVFCLK